jgi:hypothetical protein
MKQPKSAQSSLSRTQESLTEYTPFCRLLRERHVGMNPSDSQVASLFSAVKRKRIQGIMKDDGSFASKSLGKGGTLELL